jgi:hypothetical protein
MGIETEVRTQSTVTDVRIPGDKLKLTVIDSREIASAAAGGATRKIRGPS